MSARASFQASYLLFAAIAAGCVTETIPETSEAYVERFRWHDAHALASGVYRGVQIYLEVDPARDLSPEEIAWMESEFGPGRVNVRLPPIVPEVDGNVEIFRYKDIHRIEFYHGMFHVGDAQFLSRFTPHPRASLYVFKRRSGEFRFDFRGQEVVVVTRGSWIPAVYYHAEDVGADGEPADRAARKRWVRQFVEVGSSRIETDPIGGGWLVDGKRYQPDPSTPLELRSAVR